MASKKITIVLSESNAWELKIVAAILKRPVSEIVSFCLMGSTDLKRGKNQGLFFTREVQPTFGWMKPRQGEKSWTS